MHAEYFAVSVDTMSDSGEDYESFALGTYVTNDNEIRPQPAESLKCSDPPKLPQQTTRRKGCTKVVDCTS